MPASDYEKLADVGNGSLKRQYQFPLIETEFGDGFFATALIGDAAGVLTWELSWRNVHRDSGALIQAVTYAGANIGTPVSRFRYIKEFTLRRVTAPYFWLIDPSVATSRPEYVCRVVDLAKALNQQQSQKNPLLYSFTLRVQQVRGYPA